MAEDFKSPAVRNRNVQQIAELLRASSTPQTKNASEIEGQVFACCKNKTDYQAKMSRVLARLKDQVPPSSQSHPHLAAMLTGQPPPSLQGQMNQANQQMSPMSAQMGQQLGGQVPTGQMGPQIGQVGQMGNSMNPGNPQMGQGQMVSHVSQGMGTMGGLGQPMGMGGVSVSHTQGLGNQMGVAGNQMGIAGGQGGQMNVGGTQGGQMTLGGQGGQINVATGQGGQMTMNRMGPGTQVLNQMTMVGQTASGMGMGGGQVLTNTNPGMMGPGQGLVGSRMATGIGMGGLGNDMPWQNTNSHMAMSGMKGNMAGAMANKIRAMQPMPMGVQGVAAQMGGVGIGRGVSVTGSTAAMQPRIPSPNYSGAPGSGIPRQNIPSSPASMAQNQQQSNQMMGSQQPSPAFISPSPSATMIPSPVGSGRGGMMGAPSPSSSMVNTPGQPMQPSPVAAPQGEDKAYLEKVQQLQKYVDPLKNVIANCGREEGKSSEINKMKKLLDLLTNPTRRIPTETLEKCEKVLEKMLEKNDGESQAVHKESAVEVLMDGVRAALKAPNSATIFHRTIAPAVEKLTGCSIPLPPSPKRRKVEDSNESSSPKISYVIQGEIARLSPRFKVNLDSNQPACSDDLSLTCHLDDTNLPCVPPLTLTIPEKYPELPSVATLSHLEYSSTDFLKLVQNLFLRRQKHLPLSTSITMLLDTWEMSIRQACSPNAAKNPDAVSPITAIMQLMSESS